MAYENISGKQKEILESIANILATKSTNYIKQINLEDYGYTKSEKAVIYREIAKTYINEGNVTEAEIIHKIASFPDLIAEQYHIAAVVNLKKKKITPAAEAFSKENTPESKKHASLLERLAKNGIVRHCD